MKSLKRKIKKLGLLAFVLPFSKFGVARALPVAARARDMRCDEAQTLVEDNHVILFIGSEEEDDYRDLLIRDRDDCALGTHAEHVQIPAGDSPSCMVGIRCVAN